MYEIINTLFFYHGEGICEIKEADLVMKCIESLFGQIYNSKDLSILKVHKDIFFF